MRIRIWNVNKGFDKKSSSALSGDPDIAILPESSKDVHLDSWNWQWIGANSNSGLGIATKQHQSISPIRQICEPEQWMGVVEIDSPMPLVVVCVWASYLLSPRKNDMGPVRKQIDEILSVIDGRTAIVAGDFNNGAYWDRPGRADNFGDLAKEFGDAGLSSAYHSFSREELGKETQPTFFSQRNRQKAYHIDYCFIPSDWCDSIENVTVGKYEDWIGLSDHMPITVDVGSRD